MFETAATLEASLGIMAGIVDTLAIDRDRMHAAAEEGFITATAVADALVRRGMPFRAAHHVVGTLVSAAELRGVRLWDLEDDAFRGALAQGGDASAVALAADPAIGDELRAAAGIDGALATCDVIGGTAPSRVADALAAAHARLDRNVAAG